MPKSAPAREKLLILDGYSLAFRAFFALPEDLQTSDGTHTNAVYGFTSMLIKLLQEEKTDRVVCCFDVGAPLERTAEFAEYKSNRSEAPDTFKSQVPLIHEVLKVLHIPGYGVPGHEADDVIACLAKQAAADGIMVKIVTGDRDFFQIVSDDIHVLYNRRGITDIVEADPSWVEERYGVPPERYVDLKALEGDTSDNIPGVPGVGTKTAAKLVQRYGSAEAAAAHAAEQTPKLAANLAAHAEQVSLNKRLATLAEVPLEGVGVDDLRMGAWDLDQVRELFTALEFKSLLERLLADLPDAAAGEGTPFELDHVVAPTPAAITAALPLLTGVATIAVDVVPSVKRGPPRSVAIAWDANALFIPVGRGGVSSEELARAAGPLLADPARPKIAHGARIALLSLDAAGIELGGLAFDSSIAAYLLDPGAAGYPLEEVARKYTGRELRAVDGVDRPDEAQQSLLDESEDEIEAEDASLRAVAVAELGVKLTAELERLGMGDLYRSIEHPLIPVLARMERVGVRIDLGYLSDMATDLDKRVADLEAECYELAGERLNLGSPPQLRILLYEKLGLKTTRRTKTGLSTDARALQQLVDQHPFVGRLLEYRELAKLKNTYVDALPPLVDPADGRLHTTYDQTVASTGRLSSTDPNLMNIPVRTELGRQIRRAFIADEGNVLISVDYSQIELRVMAHLSRDPILLEVFKKGEDIHAETAARIYGSRTDALDTGQRSVAKMVNYGLSYGMGASGLADRLNVPIDEASSVMDAYFDQFAGVKAFLDQVVTQAHADGFTTTMFGRRRYLPELGSGNPRVRAIGERQALNAPIQGSAADIMKIAMIRVDEELRSRCPAARMILTVHDELVFEVPEEERETAERIIVGSMTTAADLAVPLEVDVSHGLTWADAKG